VGIIYPPPSFFFFFFFLQAKNLAIVLSENMPATLCCHDTKQNFIVGFDVSNFFIETKQIVNVRSKEGEEE
jgi:hypothetical protein